MIIPFDCLWRPFVNRMVCVYMCFFRFNFLILLRPVHDSATPFVSVLYTSERDNPKPCSLRGVCIYIEVTRLLVVLQHFQFRAKTCTCVLARFDPINQIADPCMACVNWVDRYINIGGTPIPIAPLSPIQPMTQHQHHGLSSMENRRDDNQQIP
jgi:hypothetical protein